MLTKIASLLSSMPPKQYYSLQSSFFTKDGMGI